MKRAPLAFLALLLLAGCGSRTRIDIEDGASLPQFRRVAVLPFADPKGEGKLIAEELSGQLRRMGHEIADAGQVAKILDGRKADERGSLGLETLELLRQTAQADAFISGRVDADRGSVSAVLVETELGDPVIRVLARPRERSQKAFRSRDELIQRLTAALLGRK